MDGFQPKPTGLFTAPEPYEMESSGPKPDRPGLIAIGAVIVPLPVTGLVANLRPMPRRAPPAWGRLIESGVKVPDPVGSPADEIVASLEPVP
jgi:hypothetical protein